MSYAPKVGDTIQFFAHGADAAEYRIEVLTADEVTVSTIYETKRYDYTFALALFTELSPFPVSVPTDREVDELERVFHWSCSDMFGVVKMAEVVAIMWGDHLAEAFLPLVRISDYSEMIDEFKDAISWLREGAVNA